MTQLIVWLQTAVAYAVPMIVLLGLLIFVHELGHFLVAKYYKVRVEVFSLGFGPKLFQFKRGDTVYAISALPLGGYVKMFGDDPTADVPEAMKAVSYLHKPVGQRIAIVLAGPLMNFFFAILIFATVAGIGEPLIASKLGDVDPTTPAYSAGFRSGDMITKVNDQEVKTWEALMATVEASGEKELSFAVTRESGATEVVKATPKIVNNKNVLSWDRKVGEIEGLSYRAKASAVGVPDPKSAAAAAGLKTGDVIVTVNGEKSETWADFTGALQKNAASGSVKLQLQPRSAFVDAKENPQAEVTLPIPAELQGKTGAEIASGLGLEAPELYVAGFGKESPGKEAGLQLGDKIVAIDDTKVASFEQLTTKVRSFQPADGQDKKLNLTIVRDGEEKKISVEPKFAERMNDQGREESRYEIGFNPMIVESMPTTIALASTSPVAAISRGFSQTIRWTSLTVLSFVRLFQAEVSAKNIGGFISIGQMAKRSWQMGLPQFLNIMAIISINLFILNLLPIPVLDGGHLVFFGVEALRGAPLSMRKIEIAQQVGLVLLLGLMVFALFNDITR